jgi:two-component system, LuxR family, response regulator FixJ
MSTVRLRESTIISASPQPTVYIVDDDVGVRKSLCWLVETLGVPVKAFDCAVSFLDVYDGACPGCLVVDVSLPGLSGLDLQRELRGRGDDIPVIVLTGFGTVPAVVDALKQGATEFLEKPVDHQFLLETIQKSLALNVRHFAEHRAHALVRERIKRLTSREHEVLGLVVEGLMSKEIATQLSVSFKTVDVHRAKIMRKMEVESIAQIVRTVVSAERHTLVRMSRPRVSAPA